MADIPNIDATDPEQLFKELLDSDEHVKTAFLEHFSTEISEFTDVMAAAFKEFEQLHALSNTDTQCALVASFLYGVLDDLVVSMKLFLSGKASASGNLMRQAIEGIAVSILTSSKKRILVKDSKGRPIEIVYWEKIEKEDRLVETSKALAQLGMNYGDLGISLDAIQKLTSSRAHYNQFSHPGLIGIAISNGFSRPWEDLFGRKFR